MTVHSPVGSPPHALAFGAHGSSIRHATVARQQRSSGHFIERRFGEKGGAGKQPERVGQGSEGTGNGQRATGNGQRATGNDGSGSDIPRSPFPVPRSPFPPISRC